MKNLFPVNILGNLLYPTDKVKNLGVIFDSEFNFSSQISAICKACYYNMRDISRIRKYLSKSATIMLANALITSRVDYCNSLLNSVSVTDLNKLQRVQNCLARMIFKKSKYCHTTPLLKELHWLPIKYRICFKQSVMVYKTITTGVPSYFKAWFVSYSSLANTRRSNPSNMVLKSAEFKRRQHKSVRHFDAAFSVCGPRLWNSLPLSVRTSENISSFRSGLKTHLFNLAYPP